MVFSVSLLSAVVIEVLNIKHANTVPSLAGTWHFIACQGPNNFRVRGERYGISHDFSLGATIEVIDFTVYSSEFLHGARTVLVFEHIDKLSEVKIW